MSHFAVSPSVQSLPPAVQNWLIRLLPQGRMWAEIQDEEAVLVLATDAVSSLYALGQLMAHWAWICRRSEEQLRPYGWLQFRFGDRTLLAVRPAWAPLEVQTPLGAGGLTFLALADAGDN